MNDFLIKLHKAFIVTGSNVFEAIGRVMIDANTGFYRGVVVLGLSYIIITALMTGNSEALRKLIYTSLGLVLVYGFFLGLPEYKYFVYDSLATLPANLGSYLTKVSIGGVQVVDGESVSATIFDMIKTKVFSSLKSIKITKIFSSIYILIVALLTGACLFILYITYWVSYLVFIFELTILSIMGLPIILVAPFQTFRPVFVSWLKAIFSAALFPVFISLIMMMVKLVIDFQEQDLNKSIAINKDSVTNSLEIIAAISIISLAATKKIASYISILSGIQDNAFTLTAPLTHMANASRNLISESRVTKQGTQTGTQAGMKAVQATGKGAVIVATAVINPVTLLQGKKKQSVPFNAKSNITQGKKK